MSELLPLTGEPLALDLVNTRPHTPDGPVDLLATPAALGTWLTLQAERLPGYPSEAALTAADLAAVHAVREHTAVAIDHLRRGEKPPASALAGLNLAQRAAPAILELGWDGTSVTAVPQRAGTVGVRLAARLAAAAGELLADPAFAAVRACEASDCVMLFLPAHPRRRWCSAARCGNRARVARYYQRHRTT
ncbi:CGNR zinc finger domain-containing protein [Acrocarpospora corrugata]|uniref:CGNR zinc finger domain-containing protein n=1 Tax=Acrocarpospora corrugata TaxID=35763 RepID=UPI0012D34F36|nr:CGNR zinc finger domain-containing protein [Acrocarpospora corrugata]